MNLTVEGALIPVEMIQPTWLITDGNKIVVNFKVPFDG